MLDRNSSNDLYDGCTAEFVDSCRRRISHDGISLTGPLRPVTLDAIQMFSRTNNSWQLVTLRNYASSRCISVDRDAPPLDMLIQSYCWSEARERNDSIRR